MEKYFDHVLAEVKMHTLIAELHILRQVHHPKNDHKKAQ